MKEVVLNSMFIDFNSFFASCEQAARPELRGKPVVVVPLMAETTCCIAASREAKPFGIKTGTSVREARQLCRDLLVIEARPEPYIRYQKDLNDVIRNCGLDPQAESVDEVHCPLWGEWTREAPAREQARQIKLALAERVSPVLTCSIGIAPNKFLAKTASDMQKPDGLVVIRPQDLPDILHPLELHDLCGIGKNMEARLRKHAITSVEILCAASRRELHDVWGSVEGNFYYDALHGLPPAKRRLTEQRTLGHSHILPPKLRTENGARSVLHRLTQKAAMRLRRAGCVTARMSIFVKSACGNANWSAEIKFNPTQDVLELLRTVGILWARGPECNYTPFAVGVNFLELNCESNAVPSLFERAQTDRRRALLEAVDHLNIDRGKNTVYFAGAYGAVEYTPMRIAFNRIPDPDTER